MMNKITDYRSPSKAKHSLSHHVAFSTSKRPILLSNSPSIKDISDKSLSHNSKKSLNLLEFRSLFNYKDPQNQVLQKKNEVFITDFGLNFHGFLKLCNEGAFTKENSRKNKDLSINEDFTKEKQVSQVISFNDLRKKAFKLNSLWEKNTNYEEKSKEIQSFLPKFSKKQQDKSKFNENHIRNIEKGREKHNKMCYSPLKELEFFNKIKEYNLFRLEKIHEQKLFTIKNYAKIIEKEVDFQNTNFKGIFKGLLKDYESVLK